jgi:aldehyde dehydrogenase (NAD+)
MNRHEEVFKRQQAYFWEKLKHSTASERVAKLRKMKKWVLSHQKDIQQALFEDLHKPAHEADIMEVLPVMAEIKDAIANLHEWTRPRRLATPIAFIGSHTQVHYEPKGVALILAPWNFPYMLTIGPLVSAIAAGCTVMVKPSEFVPATSALIEKMVGELFPEEEVAVFQGDHTMATALTALPFDHIFFTGSPQVGKLVMQAAANHLTSVTLELGGRNPVIVDETAKLGDTARKLVWGKLVNAGQSCMSPNYVLVHEKIHDKLVAKVKETYTKTYGDLSTHMQDSAEYSRQVSPRHQERLQGLVQTAVAGGAKVLLGGKGDTATRYLDPTFLTDVQLGNPILDEELFGPILPILKYQDLDEALAIIRKIEKPLALYVFSRSNRNINKVAASTSSGCVMVNETTVAFGNTELPLGGVNWSGIGKAHGHAGFLAFTNEKPVMRQNTVLPFTVLAWAPYTKLKRRLINLVIRWF